MDQRSGTCLSHQERVQKFCGKFAELLGNLREFSVQVSGVSKGGFLRGGEISIIGVGRALVAIINYASNPCKHL